MSRAVLGPLAVLCPRAVRLEGVAVRLVGVAERAVLLRLVGVAVRAVLLRLIGVDAAATGAVAFGMLAAPLAFGVAVADAAFGVAGAPTFLIGVLSSATASSRRGEGLRAIIGGDCWRATCTSVSSCRLVMLLLGRPLALGVLGAAMLDERSLLLILKRYLLGLFDRVGVGRSRRRIRAC